MPLTSALLPSSCPLQEWSAEEVSQGLHSQAMKVCGYHSVLGWLGARCAVLMSGQGVCLVQVAAVCLRLEIRTQDKCMRCLA